jgi:signal transduction histidine kinase
MAVLTMELGHLRQTLPDSESEARGVVTGLAESVSALASDIQGISHRLHSSKLDVLGLVPAARSLCTELSLQRGIAIAFAHDNVPPQLPDGVALSLFRVLQEALTNAVKYADATECTVTLRGNGTGVTLEVTDDGGGFDVAAALAGPGLGLISMQERIKLAGGVVEIASRPGAGTTVRARVPLTTAPATPPTVYARR